MNILQNWPGVLVALPAGLYMLLSALTSLQSGTACTIGKRDRQIILRYQNE